MSALRLENITKSFGAIHALTDVSLTIEPGEVVGLMGDNGAGKSTLVKVIAGNFAPTSGEIFLDGQRVEFHKPLDAQRAGIEVVYQDLALCNNLSAASNVFLGRELTRQFGPFQIIDSNVGSNKPVAVVDDGEMAQRIVDLLNKDEKQ